MFSISLDQTNWYGFDKIDGSLIRAEYSEHTGFYKFGRRSGLLDDSNPYLKEAPQIISKKYKHLPKIFKAKNWKRVVAFFEFFGDNSFAGSHQDEPHDVTLIDLSIHPKGFINIKDLLEFTNDIYHGPITKEIKYGVLSNTLPGMTFEGVVFKRTTRNNIRKMIKLKSQVWFDKLRKLCGKDQKMFARLR
jgi:hypothetical protein